MKWELLFLLLIFGSATADRLPAAMPENQIYAIDSQLSAIGIIEEGTRADWTVARIGPLENTILNTSEAISQVTYRDDLMSNGGSIIEVKQYDFSSKNQGRNTANLEQEKILTYLTLNGSFLSGGETLSMNNAGNYSEANSTVRCVFGALNEYHVPAFCTVVQAKSELINVNHAKISTKGRIRSIGLFSTPGAMTYQIAVTPDGTSGFAEGTIWTSFAGSIMESRDVNMSTTDAWNKTAGETSWKDSTRVSGGIQNLQKTFGYVSGMRL